jgi:peptide deformylase
MEQNEILDKAKDWHDKVRQMINDCPELIFDNSDNPILREKTKEVSFEEGLKVAESLKLTLAKCRKAIGLGRGLSANQIGIDKSVFVTFVDDVFKTYINPNIIESSADFCYFRELCLSSINTVADVKRPCSIVIEYVNETGEKVTDKVDRFLARLLEHEYDHLQGILNVDIAEDGGLSDSSTFDPFREVLRGE